MSTALARDDNDFITQQDDHSRPTRAAIMSRVWDDRLPID
jgi:hypothetical protein